MTITFLVWVIGLMASLTETVTQETDMMLAEVE